MAANMVTVDGNEAVADVAHRLAEVIAIYPITPSTTMGELADAWSAAGRPNIWGTVPRVVEMQSEGGAAGAIHGALQAGALATTFTASQGLLLMIPNMYKIAGELTAAVFHVAARSVATHALSIFGDHSDVMAVRATGFGMLAASSVQQAHDLALVAQAATLASRVPFLHFFDGFRTSHEVAKIQRLPSETLAAMIDMELVRAHRARGLTPERPVLRGTAQNPDVFFQGREAANPTYLACPALVQREMDHLAELTGRQYRLFDYTGAPDAERVLVLMGSAAETAEETVRQLAAAGEKVGVVNVHLYRPFSSGALLAVLPATTRAIAVLDRTKEPGAAGEPLYLDVVSAVYQALATGAVPFGAPPVIVGGRYGLSSKEFTPAMAKGVLDALAGPTPRQGFTVGIDDDVTHTSLAYDPAFTVEDPETVRAVFYGLGSDGTVGANKNAIKIIGAATDLSAQGYFVYDSKKAGTVTTSHLRFGPRPIRAPYLIAQASFVACHQFSFLERLDVLELAAPGAVFLLNSPYGPATVWSRLPREVQETIVARGLKLWVIDAGRVARSAGLGGRINTIMQTCFFALSGVLPRDAAVAAIKDAIRASYGKRGEAVVARNFGAVDEALAHLYEVPVPTRATTRRHRRSPVPADAPPFVRDVLGPMIAGQGDLLPVSLMPVDGTFPVGTARYEKRNLATEIPTWDPDLCIQCGKCVMVCPHAAIRQKVFEPAALAGAPASFVAVDAHYKELPGQMYALQVAPEDCTGCTLCVAACPAVAKDRPAHKALDMAPQAPIRERERANWDFYLSLPEVDRTALRPTTVKNAQLFEPLFEFSGACVGCGETPYLKLLSQLFGDRALVANATGCSSIFGGNLPTTPWSANKDGRGPAWSNSLFEDNAEFGLGMRLALDHQREHVRLRLPELVARGWVDEALVADLLAADQSTEAGIRDQRARVATLLAALAGTDNPLAVEITSLADALVTKSVWIVGGDGWAYDIGYGGLDHVLASGQNVNVLVLDTEVYSNTGGQASKSTPRGAVARFAAEGKALPKKDLGLVAMAYGHVYVARVALGANDQQTLRAFLEAEAHPGPSLILAYAHCIAHGIDMTHGLEQQRLAVRSGYWPLYRFDPGRSLAGQSPLVLSSKDPAVPLSEFTRNETRYQAAGPDSAGRSAALMQQAQRDVDARWALYRRLAELHLAAAQDSPAVVAAPSPDRRPTTEEVLS